MSKKHWANPEFRAAILDQIPADLPAGNKPEKPRSVILGSRGQPMNFLDDVTMTERPIIGFSTSSSPLVIIDDPAYARLPPPGDTGEESISAQEEMRTACAWLMSLGEDDAAGALVVIRTMREGWTP